MVFSDLFFIYIFLPLFLMLYFFNNNIKLKNTVIVVFSLFFYSWGAPQFLPLLIISSLVDYVAGLFIEKNYSNKKYRIAGLLFSLIINLGILFVFKYSGFIVSNINVVLNVHISVPDIKLPVGISFYTFQTISYVADVYKGKTKAQKNYFYYLMYLSMFFQLVAGPIVRYDTIAEEITCRKTTITEYSKGLQRFICGLSKKVILANTFGSLVSLNIGNGNPVSVFSTWFGIILFALQIYFDFSGYSDMAIGLGLMCGFHFVENFNYPYISKSATEFWRRWHISLGSFFRDYVYIPMGGNRRHQIINLAVVWLLTGLWHGASWNFVLWGLYFGAVIIIEKLFFAKVLEKIPAFLSHIYALFIILVGWALFYFTDMSSFLMCIKSMFGFADIPFIDEVSKSQLINNLFIIMVATVICCPIYKFVEEKLENVEKEHTSAVVAVNVTSIVLSVGLLVVSSALLVGETYNPFLYFRF